MTKRKSPSGRRGRPLGFKLSEESKRAISDSKRGQKHKETTKEKISKSLIIHFRQQNPLSEELINRYSRFDEEMCEWIYDVREEIDSIRDVRTMKSMRNTRRMELTCGDHIEYFSHDLTPEVIALFLELCQEKDIDPDELFDSL